MKSAYSNSFILVTPTPAQFAPDIDILNEQAAEAVEMLAREQFEKNGHLVVRFGQAPTRAGLLRTDEPFSKITADFIAPGGASEKIEIVSDGQQLDAPSSLLKGGQKHWPPTSSPPPGGT